jgi:alanine racemase
VTGVFSGTAPDTAPLKLSLDGTALVENWRWLARRSGSAACGAAVKADGYGLGAAQVVRRLSAAGCRDFLVATWAEAAALAPHVGAVRLCVLHGVREADMALARTLDAIPVLNSAAQVQRWKASGGGECDVMVDTGMNRLGLTPQEATSGLLDGLSIGTLMSHLASADEDVPQNGDQLRAFRALADHVPARRRSLANSAGICLGADYAFDLTRPGLALYGGMPRAEAAGHIRPVVTPQAEILQVRTVPAGACVGYNATWRAERDTRVAIINLGYADGYLRAFSDRGSAVFGDCTFAVIGRVSMDLVALALPDDCPAGEGDMVSIAYDLAECARLTGLSPYELLTGLGQRYARIWQG